MMNRITMWIAGLLVLCALGCATAGKPATHTQESQKMLKEIRGVVPDVAPLDAREMKSAALAGKDPDFMAELRESEREKKLSKLQFEQYEQRWNSITLYRYALERAKAIDKEDIEPLKKKLMVGKW